MSTYDLVRKVLDQHWDTEPMLFGTDRREFKLDVLAARVTEELTREAAQKQDPKVRQEQADNAARQARDLLVTILGSGRDSQFTAEALTDALQKHQLLVSAPRQKQCSHPESMFCTCRIYR